MANLYICPFYTSEDPFVIRCEAGTIRFPTRKSMSAYRKRFCGGFDYEDCTIAWMLSEFYEEGVEREDDTEQEPGEADDLADDEEGGPDSGAGPV